MKILSSALLCLALLAASAAQAQEAARAWSVSTPKAPEDTAFLSFGAPGTDDVGLALSCKVKTGQVSILFDVNRALAVRQRGGVWIDTIGRPAPWLVDVVVASGVQRVSVRGLANPDQMNGGSTVTAEVSTQAPVVAAFAKTGLLHVESLGTTVEEPPAPKRHVAKFLRACR